MATIPVPLTTDVSPWVWFDAADPTMIRANASNVLTSWSNKGLGGSTSTVSGSPLLLSDSRGKYVNFPTTATVNITLTPTTQAYSFFVVANVTGSSGASTYVNFLRSASSNTPSFEVDSGNRVMLVNAGIALNTAATIPDYTNKLQLYAGGASATSTSNNFITLNGEVLTKTIDPLVSNISTGVARTYQINYVAGGTSTTVFNLYEMIGYQGEMTATQRMQIEGYLAWKWGLQANLPAAHPYSVANKAATMALYGRPHGFTTVFVNSLTGVRGIVCDSVSNVYVARGTNNDIRKYNTSGTLQWTITTVAGFTCNEPTHICRDLSDNIYVAETTGQRILKITAAGSASVFKTSIPVGPIAVDSAGAVYYYDTVANNIKKITADGATTTTFYSGGASTGLVCDASNNIYAAHNFAITKITQDGSGSIFVGTAGSSGSTDAIGTSALFNNDATSSMSIDNRGYIYVAEYSGKKIRMISPAGAVLTITGQTGVTTPTAASDNGIDINARYSSASAVAVAPDGSIYIGDRIAGNIRKIGVGVMNQVGTIAGPPSGSATSGNGTGNASGAIFGGVLDCVYQSDGTMYFVDFPNSRICKMTPAGIISTFRSGRQCTGIALDGNNNLYSVFPGQAIYKNTPAGLETTFASALNGYGLACDASNNLYFADSRNYYIRRYAPDGTMTTVAGTGTSVAVDGTGSGASLQYPLYIARGPSGNFYISAYVGGGSLRKMTPGGVVTTLCTLGATEVPYSVAVDSSENVYFAVRYTTETATNGLIRMITPAGVVSTIAGGGSGTATDAVGTAATFYGNLYNICVDQYNNIFVADQSNYKVRMVARNAPPSGSVVITGTLTQGQALTADTSSLVEVNGLGTLSYAWSASSTANGVYTTIAGATGSTLTLAEAQVAKFIRVVVSYTDGRGSAESVSSAAVGAIVNVNDTAVGLDISGTLASGSTLTAITANIVDPDGNAPPYTYQWASSSSPSSGFSNIGGATSSTYALTLSEVGKYIRLTVGYTNNYGAADSAVATTASVVINPNSPVQGTLSISGDLIEGRTLTANTSNISDADGLGVFSYTWSSSATNNGTFVVDASGSSSMTLVAGQANRYIKLEVRYVDGKGNAEYIASSVVGPVIAATVPSAPTGASSTATVLGASLSWSAPSDNGYMPILGYRVFDASSTLVVDTSGLSHSISGLNARQTYTYTVVAYNAKGNSAAATVSVVPLSPPVTAIETGAIPEAVQIPITVAGVEAVVEKITPAVEADGTKTVSFAPEPTKTAVAIANLPAEVEKVVVATAAPQNGYTTLKISAFNSAGSSVSNFAASPLTITLGIPGYTSETVLVRTFQTIGGPVSDSVVATRNSDGTYTMTLTHLTYIRVSQNIECVVAGTKILTATGYKAVEEIKDGELIATADGRALPCKVYITEINETTKETAPYLIQANTFGPRCPARDLTLSPLHAVQLRRGVWQIPKAAATIYAGVRQLPIGRPCTYYHLEMPNYLTDNIVADGTVVESYGARQLKGRRVEYKFDDVVGGFTRTITEARRAPVKRA